MTEDEDYQALLRSRVERREKNPMWVKVYGVIADHTSYALGDEEATDDVMDVVYGKGRW